MFGGLRSGLRASRARASAHYRVFPPQAVVRRGVWLVAMRWGVPRRPRWATDGARMRGAALDHSASSPEGRSLPCVSKQSRALSPRWEALREAQEAAVAAAVIAIVADDPANLNVAAIAERAGISRQTFYKQFDSLELAVVTTHRRVVHELPTRIGQRMEVGVLPANGLERLLRIFEAFFEVYTDDPALLRFTTYYDFSFRVHRMSAADRETHPLVPPSYSGGGAMYDMFRAGQRDGSIDPRLEVERTMRALTTSLLGVIQRLQIQDDWTDGRDQAARETYTAMIEFWGATLSSP